MSWSVAMLAGTLCYDIITRTPSRGSAAGKLALWGIVMLAIAYGLSCMTRLYDIDKGPEASTVKRGQAASPVWPPFENASKAENWSDLLAEPPFVQPDPERLEKRSGRMSRASPGALVHARGREDEDAVCPGIGDIDTAIG